MLSDLRPAGMDIKRNLSLILLTVSLTYSCVQRQVVSSRDVAIDPAAGLVEQLPTITVEALQERINSADSATFILDVRTPEEYDGPLGHIKGARLMPLQELSQRLNELSDMKDQPIFVICRSGGRSAQATRMLLDAGFQATNVAGGMLAWNDLIEKQREPEGNPD